MLHGVGAWLSLLTLRPSQPHGALRGKASRDADDGRTHEEQGGAEVQDETVWGIDYRLIAQDGD